MDVEAIKKSVVGAGLSHVISQNGEKEEPSVFQDCSGGCSSGCAISCSSGCQPGCSSGCYAHGNNTPVGG